MMMLVSMTVLLNSEPPKPRVIRASQDSDVKVSVFPHSRRLLDDPAFNLFGWHHFYHQPVSFPEYNQVVPGLNSQMFACKEQESYRLALKSH